MHDALGVEILRIPVEVFLEDGPRRKSVDLVDPAALGARDLAIESDRRTPVADRDFHLAGSAHHERRHAVGGYGLAGVLVRLLEDHRIRRRAAHHRNRHREARVQRGQELRTVTRQAVRKHEHADQVVEPRGQDAVRKLRAASRGTGRVVLE